MLYALQEIRTHASGELPWVREVVRVAGALIRHKAGG